MGRPLKTKVSETSPMDVAAVVARVAKKLKSFSKETLTQAVYKSFQKTDEAAELHAIDNFIASYLVQEASKYSVSNGVYSVIPGKRGRPRKVAVEAAVAV